MVAQGDISCTNVNTGGFVNPSDLVTGRRTSARIQRLKEDNAYHVRYGEDQASAKNGEGGPRKRPRNSKKLKLKGFVGATSPEHKTNAHPAAELLERSAELSNNCRSENGTTVIDGVEVEAAASTTLTMTDVTKAADETLTEEKNAYSKITQTLRTFNKYHLHFIQEEKKREALAGKKPETKSKSNDGDKRKAKAQKKAKKISKSDEDNTEGDTKQISKRPDLKAMSKMMQMNEALCPGNRIGPIPGVEVGHQFFSRVEMVVVGFHSHWLNGIDYIGSSTGAKRQGGKQSPYRAYKLPIAVCIVLSGQYEDDLDHCEDVVYTGQGGNDLLGNKRQFKDQVMQRGNLGLKNSMEQSLPVRVVRGHKCASSYVRKVYTYDGLYQVVSYWAEKGVSGHTVFKFRLKRIDGQAPLTTDQVHFIRGRIPSSITEMRGLICKDISEGLENIPIPATNLVDDVPLAPAGFTYIKCLKVAKNITLPQSGPGCKCKGMCVDPRSCTCAKLNGSDFPYVHHNGGRLIEPKAVVFECGPSCGCGPGCLNRTSQKGLNYRLEVFRTLKKGWGVRSWDYIPSGAPVCEYIGFLKKTDEIDPAADNNYVFDIDCLQTMKGLDGREKRLGDVSLPAYLEEELKESDSVPEFCIDAGLTGNVARFINHSCQPNLFVQCVLSTHQDVRLARIVLIAADNIPALKELTYDYAYALDSVMDPDGNVKQMACYCGAPDCRKRLY